MRSNRVCTSVHWIGYRLGKGDARNGQRSGLAAHMTACEIAEAVFKDEYKWAFIQGYETGFNYEMTRFGGTIDNTNELDTEEYNDPSRGDG